VSKKAPKVFVSYSHDDPDHKKWVASLAIKLRENGVDAVLDQWDLFPGEDVPAFMEKNLSDCDFVILICTKRYVEKANAGEGGVGYEKMIVSAEMIKNMDAGKFIPIIRQHGSQSVPIFIQTKLYLDLSNDEYFEIVFDELLRAIFKSVVSKKPPLGQTPNFEDANPKERKFDGLSDHAAALFREMINLYDSGATTYFLRSDFGSQFSLGKIAAENAILVLEARGLVERDRDGDFLIFDKGKSFAVENNIV